MTCYFFTVNIHLTFVTQRQLRCGSEVAGSADLKSAYIHWLTLKKSHKSPDIMYSCLQSGYVPVLVVALPVVLPVVQLK